MALGTSMVRFLILLAGKTTIVKIQMDMNSTGYELGRVSDITSRVLDILFFFSQKISASPFLYSRFEFPINFARFLVQNALPDKNKKNDVIRNLRSGKMVVRYFQKWNFGNNHLLQQKIAGI